MIQLASLGSALQGALKQGKISKVEAGSKTFTKPKTVFGKLIGGVTGRTQAYQYQEALKSGGSIQQSSSVSSRQNFPVSGSVAFGQETVTKNYLPWLVVIGGVLAYIFGGKKRRTRR